MARRRKLDPYSNERPEAIELLARMMVGSSFRPPLESGSTKISIGQADVACAAGFMYDKLQRETAIAVATRAGQKDLARVAAIAYRQVVKAAKHIRPEPINLRKAENRFRLRLITFDALNDLVWPERSKSYREKARAAKTRLDTYITLHRCASAILQCALDNAVWDFEQRMFYEHENNLSE